MRLPFLVSLPLIVLACTPAEVPDGMFACQVDGDCTAGLVCVRDNEGYGRCESTAAGDAAAAPDADLPDVAVPDADSGEDDGPETAADAEPDADAGPDADAEVVEDAAPDMVEDVIVDSVADAVIDITDIIDVIDVIDTIEDVVGEVGVVDDVLADVVVDAVEDVVVDAVADAVPDGEGDADADASIADADADVLVLPNIKGGWYGYYAGYDNGYIYIEELASPTEIVVKSGDEYGVWLPPDCEGTFDGTTLVCTFPYTFQGSPQTATVTLTYFPDFEGQPALSGTWHLPTSDALGIDPGVTFTPYP